MKGCLTVVALLLVLSQSYGQSTYHIRGKVLDTTGAGILGATVRLISKTDTLSENTNEDGLFVFNNVKARRFTLFISNLGYHTFEQRFTLPESNSHSNLEPVLLLPQSYNLDQVLIKGRKPIIMKKDTIEYLSRYYKVKENAFVEDLLKKLPGIYINDEGYVLAQGKVISRVRLNGNDFFGGDVDLALKNIPANLIEKVQIIEEYGDMSRLTGIYSGRPQRILNIKTWADIKDGYFINAAAGAGNRSRYQTSGMGNYFNNSRELGAYLKANNNNTDIPGTSGADKRNTQGLTDLTSTGLNYREKYNKQLSLSGNYRFSNTDNRRVMQIHRENIYTGNEKIINHDNSLSSQRSYFHNVELSLDYQIDSLNYFQIAPYTLIGSTINTRDGLLAQRKYLFNFLGDSLLQKTIENASASLPSFGTRIIYNRKFKKPGRNIYTEINLRDGINNSRNSMNARTSFYNSEGKLSIDSIQRQYLKLDNSTFDVSAKVSLVEPLTSTVKLELTIQQSVARTYNNRRINLGGTTGNIDTLGNKYNYTFTTTTTGLAARHSGKKQNLSIGVNVQPTVLMGKSVLKGIDVRRKGLNIMPEFNYSYLMSQEKTLGITYNANSNPPAYYQLQPVTDYTNPQYPVTGNPALKSELYHNIEFNYNSFNSRQGTSLFTSLNASFVQDQVVINNVLLTKGDNVVSQEALFENTDGSYRLGGIYNYTVPLSEQRYIVSLSGLVDQSHSVSITNFVKNTSKTLILSQTARLQANLNSIEFYPFATFVYNRSTYSIGDDIKYKLSTWVLGASAKYDFMRSYTLSGDVSQNLNYGLVDNIRTNTLLLNLYFEKRLLKKEQAGIKFIAYDLLNQNATFERKLVNNAILDIRGNRLGRYFMILFTYKLNRYKTV